LLAGLCSAVPMPASVVLPELVPDLVCFYDFDHPVEGNAGMEADLGLSGTDIDLVNGGAAMRLPDGAHAASTHSLQTQQLNPDTAGNDDWKAGIYDENGVASLGAFGSVTGITVMGWVKPTGTNPNLNSNTPDPNDLYNAVGLFGVLSGDSDGHGVRALLEVINVSGTLRLVALGRRIDGGSSLTLAATNDWQSLLPSNTWTHVAATFDFDAGTMSLYRNGAPLGATYTAGGDPWGVIGGAEPDVTSPSNPAGIKIGGSFPQNTAERNPFNGRFDDLMFFNRSLSADEVQAQFANFTSTAPPTLAVARQGGAVTVSWPTTAAAFSPESSFSLAPPAWGAVGVALVTNGDTISITLPISSAQQFFRVAKH